VYRNLLVPLDGSTFAERGLRPAASIADRAGATLRLVLVHTPIVVDADLAPVQVSVGWKEAQREREFKYLEREAEALRGRGLSVKTELRDGDVGTELLEIEAESDLVVMATHGRGGLARAWLGSVADQLVRHATGPLLLMRPTEAEHEDGSVDTEAPPFRHVLAATDGSEAASAAVDQAVALARLFDARLTLLRVVAFPAWLAAA
jgi:nucleotide-binding universal stress UspA family protein